MSQQPTKYERKASVYEQIQIIDGVCEVEMFDFAERGVGIFVVGGSDEDISDALASHTYGRNVNWFLGDTEHKREFSTSKWYRNYYTFDKKFKELLGDAEVNFKPFQEKA